MKKSPSIASQNELYPEGRKGNSTPVNPNAAASSVTPLYTTLPLTDYRYRYENGRQIFNIDDEEVEQMRDFSMENKK